MELVATRYESRHSEWDFVFTNTTQGWSVTRYPGGSTKIPPMCNIVTGAGWQPVLNQTVQTRYFVSPEHAVKYVEEHI